MSNIKSKAKIKFDRGGPAFRESHKIHEVALPKPKWIRVKAPTSSSRFNQVKSALRQHKLVTVCEEASCPNIAECFGHGTATFMILGSLCTRRCPFCDVAHGRPLPPDEDEPKRLADSIAEMKLSHVVITSVDRDDLRDGGASHFVKCIQAIRVSSPDIKIEVLVPDFRGRLDKALSAFEQALPDVMNHNLETVPRLYRKARPGADYQHSLTLLQEFQKRYPDVVTKSGLMVGLGEELDEIRSVMRDMRSHDVSLLTVGQYLAPSSSHLKVERFVTPEEFKQLEVYGHEIGFLNAACGPMVRSSYHAEKQALGLP